MLGGDYRVDVDWGDNGHSGGQAWTVDGQGHWVATGSHTYDAPGQYDVTVNITDTHADTGMTATATSTIEVSGPSTPPASNGGLGGAPSVDVLAVESLFGRERKPEGNYTPSDGSVAAGPRAESRVVIAPLPVQASVSASLLDSTAVRPSHRPTPADLLEPLERLSTGVADVLAENLLA